MGQKKSKFMESTETLNSHKLMNINTSGTFTSSLKSSSSFYNSKLFNAGKSKSYLESGISNDSGCYSDKALHVCTDSLCSRSKLASPNLNEFELMIDKDNLVISKMKRRSSTRRQKQSENLCKQINKILTKSLAQVIIFFVF